MSLYLKEHEIMQDNKAFYIGNGDKALKQPPVINTYLISRMPTYKQRDDCYINQF